MMMMCFCLQFFHQNCDWVVYFDNLKRCLLQLSSKELVFWWHQSLNTALHISFPRISLNSEHIILRFYYSYSPAYARTNHLVILIPRARFPCRYQQWKSVAIFVSLYVVFFINKLDIHRSSLVLQVIHLSLLVKHVLSHTMTS